MEFAINNVVEELKTIRKELVFIKRSMPNKNMFLDSEEAVLLQESFKNEKEGRLLSSKKLRKELNI
ncbi:MAG: hypothetical protein KJ674_00135 [Nanoarchaeota archaeon]|nr:hypothetical protein [Nanoarchaeota archaeon]